MTEPAKMLTALANDCEKTAQSSSRYSRRHYYFSYLLMIVSLAGSIGAAVLAFWDQIDRIVVGIVALLPAIGTSVADQLRLVEKGNWHFRRKHAMERLVRDLRLTIARNPDWEAVDAANRTLAELDERLEADWGSQLAFRFKSSEAAAPTKGA